MHPGFTEGGVAKAVRKASFDSVFEPRARKLSDLGGESVLQIPALSGIDAEDKTAINSYACRTSYTVQSDLKIAI